MKRFTALALALVMTLSLCPVSVWAETLLGAPVYEVTGSYVAEDDGISNDELFAAYFQRELDESLGYETPGFYSTSALEEGTLEKEVYDVMKAGVEQIAAGDITSAMIALDTVDQGWTAADLGINEDEIYDAEIEDFTQEFYAAFAPISEKIDLAYTCLLLDCPMDLYWHDKTVGFGYGIAYANSVVTIPYVVFFVATDYSVGGAVGSVEVDTDATGATSTAIANAKIIVENNADKSDLEKLAAYKDVICERVSYNDAAADAGDSYEGINPWQMIYVFDGNPATNVVCEGYAKAFQYLCDLSTFDGDIECHTVHGYMDGEAHMWNVVAMDDGKNYLVDVTNCDDDNPSDNDVTIGYPDKLFMAYTANSANSNQWHSFAFEDYSGTNRAVTYSYDPSMADLFCDGYLPISTSVYEKPTLSASATLTGGSFIQAGSDVTLTLTVSGSNISGIYAALHYDSEVFEFVGAASLLTGWSFEQNEGVYTLHHATDAFNEAEVLQVTLRVKERIAAGTALNASFNNITVSDGHAEADISSTSWSGTVATSPQARWGLANGTDAPTTWVGSGTLSQAMSYANGLFYSTAYIQLRRDVNTSYVFAINDSKTAILDLNGYDITRTIPSPIADGNVITVQGTLTICDTYSSDVSKQGKISGGNDLNYAGGIWVESNAAFTMDGGNISENFATTQGGGVYNSGTFTMNGGRISGNTAKDSGGGVFVINDGFFFMNGGTISENTSKYGGGVHIFSTADGFAMSGGTISENTAWEGGGLYMSNKSSTAVSMSGGTISNNKAAGQWNDGYGGGVYVNTGTFILTGGTISENDAILGGGIYGSASIDGGTISRNTATAGAGVYLLSGGSLVSGAITNNSASLRGGGVLLRSNGAFAMTGGTISGNTASSKGGGVIVEVGTFYMKGGSIKENISPAYGAGVTVESSGNINLSINPVISDNKTDTSAAAVVSNLYLPNNKTITVDGALGVNANVGVTLQSGSGTFAVPYTYTLTTLNKYIGCFVSDNAAYEVAADGNNLKLVEMLAISFDANGGSGTMAAQTVEKGTATALNANTFTRASYMFTGWNTAANGSGTAYADGASITAESAVTLYAQWKYVEARWGLANGTAAPETWAGNGTFIDAVVYANTLPSGTAYIQLRNDITTTYGITFRSGKTVILDLYGKTVDRGLAANQESTSAVFAIEGNLTLCDTSTNVVAEQGVITGGRNSTQYGTNNNRYAFGGGVHVASSGVFTMKGGRIEGNVAYQGGGVFSLGTFTMSGGAISDNSVSLRGGGACIEKGTFTMTGGFISNNTAKNGGGVNVSNGTITISGGEISYNTATQYGGGVHSSDDTFTMSGGSISNNNADVGGGGVFIAAYSTFTMTGGAISDNEAKSVAGGVYAPANATFIAAGGSITDNNADSGGGVYVAGTLKVSGAPSISDNTSGTGSATTANNVYLNGAPIAVGTLTTGANIGVTSWSGTGKFTSGGASYANSGYFTSDNAAYEVAADGNNLKLTEVPVTITFKDNGGSGTMAAQTVTSGVATALNANKFTRELHTFTGWNTKANGTGTAYSDKEAVTLTNDTILYAQWKHHEARWGQVSTDTTIGGSHFVDGNYVGSGTLSEAMAYANGDNPYVWTHRAYIRLLTDVEISSPLEFVSGKTTFLDLNGYTIDRGLTEATENGNVITVNGSLMICDRSDSASGKITGGFNSGLGGGVVVAANGLLNMRGGTISGNSTSEQGGGIYISEDTTVYVGGGSVISGNTKGASASNVYIESGELLKLGGLTSGANIGVTLAEGTGVFTDGGAASASYVTSDNDAYAVVSDGSGNLMLAEKTSVTVSGMVTSFLSAADAENDVTVELWAEGATTATYTITASGNSAEYIFEGVEAGIYTMKVSKANHVTREYEVTVDSEAVELDVKICPKGDVNLDESVNYMDLQRLYQHLSANKKVTDYALVIANLNEIGNVDYMDLQKLYQILSA